MRLYLDLIRWDRPAGWLLLLWPTLSALWLAKLGPPDWHLLLVFVLGTVLMRSAGCCVNDVADRHFDHQVQRTALRPVTTGRLSVRQALACGALLALLAFGLVLSTNRVAVCWSFAALLIGLIYPFAKRFFAMPQAVLGLAFGMGIPMAYAAVSAEVPGLAWGLVLGNGFWVLAYDTEYAMVDREDDLRIGLKTSAITLGRFDVAAIVVFYSLHLLIWALLVGPLIAGTKLWLGLSLALAAAQVIWHYRLIRERSREACLRAFRVNHWLGFTLFMGVFLSFL